MRACEFHHRVVDAREEALLRARRCDRVRDPVIVSCCQARMVFCCCFAAVSTVSSCALVLKVFFASMVLFALSVIANGLFGMFAIVYAFASATLLNVCSTTVECILNAETVGASAWYSLYFFDVNTASLICLSLILLLNVFSSVECVLILGFLWSISSVSCGETVSCSILTFCASVSTIMLRFLSLSSASSSLIVSYFLVDTFERGSMGSIDSAVVSIAARLADFSLMCS